MPSKVQTNDEDKRKEFKEQALQRVSKVLKTPVEGEILSMLVEVDVPSNFWELSDVELYGVLKYQQLTPEQTTRVLNQLKGYSPDTKEFKIFLQTPVVEEEVFVQSNPITQTIHIELPHDFKAYPDREKFLFLTRERALSAEKANDLVFVLNGEPPINPHIEYSITFSERVAEGGFVEKELLTPIDIVLPHGFNGLKRVYQETMLTSEYDLSILEAFDVLSAIKGEQPLYYDREIIIKYEEPVVEEKAQEVGEFPELTVTLPDLFKSLRPQEQYLYLKSELRLTGDQANDVISVFRGNSPIYSKVTLD